jgi:beta-galactosidase/beta-glucuronidase
MGKKKFVPVELYTAEGEGLCGMPHGEYPRPSLVRDSFFCLNGEWELTDTFGEVCKIKVPFPPESLLSGVNRRMGEHPRLTYKRSFALPEGFARGRVILHFGAVDQIAHVWLNGQKLGDHVGGYEGFSFDVTELLCPENSLEVVAENAADPLSLPYGKQCEKRGGMWYTPISGIWQTVWLESVPDIYVRSLSYKVDGTSVELTAEGVSDGEVTVRTPQGELTAKLSGGCAVIELGDVRLWSPEDPYLYRYTVVSGEDRVESYFAVRTVSCEKVGGVSRICLNGRPCFLHGLLDQGYFSDGIFTPASPKCFEKDILTAKELGFNMLRKHLF